MLLVAYFVLHPRYDKLVFQFFMSIFYFFTFVQIEKTERVHFGDVSAHSENTFNIVASLSYQGVKYSGGICGGESWESIEGFDVVGALICPQLPLHLRSMTHTPRPRHCCKRSFVSSTACVSKCIRGPASGSIWHMSRFPTRSYMHPYVKYP